MRTETKEWIRNLAGSDNVTDDLAAREIWQRDESTVSGVVPELVVRVEAAEQVPQLINGAKEQNVSLIPVSSGGLHRRGDTVPQCEDAVILDLSGMNRILHISRQQRIAVIEPGVTYPQLQKALAEEGMVLSTPLAPRGCKSVIGSVLEIEPRLNCIHQWEYYEPLRCTEVTWGDGNTIFTGEAGRGPKDLPAQWDSQKWQVTGAGPNMIDFVRLLTGAQGTMGIVSWASLKCEVKPTIHQSYFIASDDLQKLIDFTYKVIRPRFSDELFIIHKQVLAAIIGAPSCGETPAVAEDAPQWAVFCGIAGREILPEMRVKQQYEDIRDMAEECGLEMAKAFAGVDGEAFYEMINGTTDCGDWREGSLEIPFVTTMDKAPGFVRAAQQLLNVEGLDEDRLMVYIQPQHCGTSAHVEFLIKYSKTDGKQKQEAEAWVAKAAPLFGELGAYYSRPYGQLAQIQLPKDPTSCEVQKQLKQIFDPEGVMNPGKLTLK